MSIHLRNTHGSYRWDFFLTRSIWAIRQPIRQGLILSWCTCPLGRTPPFPISGIGRAGMKICRKALCCTMQTNALLWPVCTDTGGDGKSQECGISVDTYPGQGGCAEHTHIYIHRIIGLLWLAASIVCGVSGHNIAPNCCYEQLPGRESASVT